MQPGLMSRRSIIYIFCSSALQSPLLELRAWTEQKKLIQALQLIPQTRYSMQNAKLGNTISQLVPYEKPDPLLSYQHLRRSLLQGCCISNEQLPASTAAVLRCVASEKCCAQIGPQAYSSSFEQGIGKTKLSKSFGLSNSPRASPRTKLN